MSPAEVLVLVLELAQKLGVPVARAVAAACELRPELRDVEIPDAAAVVDRELDAARRRVERG